MIKLREILNHINIILFLIVIALVFKILTPENPEKVIDICVLTQLLNVVILFFLRPKKQDEQEKKM